MINERLKNASQRAEKAERQQRIAQKQEDDLRRKQEERRKYILGGLILKYFPELNTIDPGKTKAETCEAFKYVDAFLQNLSSRSELVQEFWNTAISEVEQSTEDADM